MRVLLINNTAVGGGAQRVFSDTYLALEARGVEVTCAYAGQDCDDIPRRRIELLDATTRRFPLHLLLLLWSPTNAWRILKAILNHRPDIVHIHTYFGISPSVLVPIWLMKQVSNLRCVHTVHNYYTSCVNQTHYDHRRGVTCQECSGSFFKTRGFRRRCDKSQLKFLAKWLWGFETRLLLRMGVVDVFITPSRHALKVLSDETYLKGPKQVVRNPVSSSGLGTEARKGRVICHFGRFSAEKGIDVLLHAFRLLLGEAGFEDFRLRIIGTGPEESRIRSMIQQLGIENQVEIRPFMKTEALRREVESALVCVFPSKWYETFSLATVESVSWGTIPIVSDLGALSENVQYLGCGRTFAAGDPVSLKEVVVDVVRNLEEESNRLNMGREKLRESSGEYVDELMRAYQDASDRALRGERSRVHTRTGRSEGAGTSRHVNLAGDLRTVEARTPTKGEGAQVSLPMVGIAESNAQPRRSD